MMQVGNQRNHEETKLRTVRLGFYPYTYARVSAMKGKLIKQLEYQKLLKMRMGEIAKFLEELEYKKEIDELGVLYSGADLLERALNTNLARMYDKLRRISPGELVALIDVYLLRKDFWNIKTILRGKFVKEKPETIKKLLIPAGSNFQLRFLEGLVEKESIPSIIQLLRIPELGEAYAAFEKSQDLFELENALDRAYFTHMIAFTELLPKQGRLFATFLRNEIDIHNVMILLRLKREQIPKENIMEYLFFPGERLKKEKAAKMLDMPMEDIFKELTHLGFVKSGSGVSEEKALVSLELELMRNLLDRAMLLLHQNPLSVDVILGYMFAKEIEVRNLKAIIKGKQLGVEQEFLEQTLVIGG